MAYSVDTAWFNMYEDSISLLSQQLNSVLENTGKVGEAKGEYKYFDRIGSVAMSTRSSSNEATSFTDVTHDKRVVNFADYALNMYVDDVRDLKRMLTDPTSAYVTNAVAAYKRTIDSVINTAILGTATTGKGVGGTFGSQAFSNNYVLDVKYVTNDPVGDGNGTGTYGTDSGFTLAKVLKAKSLLLGGHGINSGDQIYCVIGEQEEIELFGINEFKNADYVDPTKKAFELGIDPNGYIKNWLGINFLRYTGLTETDPAGADNHYRSCYMYTTSGLGIVKDAAPRVVIQRNPERNMAYTINVQGSVGAVRLEEEKVVEIRTSNGLTDAS